MILNKKLYDILAKISRYALPALGGLYYSLADMMYLDILCGIVSALFTDCAKIKGSLSYILAFLFPFITIAERLLVC